MTLQEKHQDTILAHYLELVSSVNYHNINVSPFYNDMEAWEAKEYMTVYNGTLETIENYKNVLMQNEAIFNQMLCEYNLSVVVFIAKYSVN